jgi:hypothetical protein
MLSEPHGAEAKETVDMEVSPRGPQFVCLGYRLATDIFKHPRLLQRSNKFGKRYVSHRCPSRSDSFLSVQQLILNPAVTLAISWTDFCVL